MFGDVEPRAATEERSDVEEEQDEADDASAPSETWDSDVNPPEDLVDAEGNVVVEGRDSAANKPTGPVAQDIAAIKKSMGKAYNGATVRLAAPKTLADRQIVDVMAQMGRTVVFLDIRGDGGKDGDVRGVVLGRNGNRIYLRSGMTPVQTASAALHEFGHSLRRANPDLYRRLKRALGDARIEAGSRQYRRALAQTFGENHAVTGRFDMSADMREDKGVAVAIEGMANDTAVRRLMLRDPSLFTRVREWIMATLS